MNLESLASILNSVIAVTGIVIIATYYVFSYSPQIACARYIAHRGFTFNCRKASSS